MLVRPATPRDLDAVTRLCCALWPDAPAEDHGAAAAATLSGRPDSTLPLALFLAEEEGAAIGFVEVGLRSHADGCDPKRPVGFVEGWYVEPAHRRRGVGRALLAAAEAWARTRGCTELASDTWLDAEVSQRAHAALGFSVAGRTVNFRKSLG